MPETLHHFVNGARTKGDSGQFGDVFDPATGEVTKRVPMASASDMAAAIAAAEAAFPAWAAQTPLRRARVMFKFKDLLERHTEELIDLVVSEHGKVREDARGSITRGIEVVEFACGIPHLLKGEFSENVGTAIDSWSMRQPLGVCGAIAPFNFPVMVPLWTIPVALACGNTFVMKPSEKVPSAMLRIAELAKEAGVPDGVLNVVNGGREAVDALLSDPRVASISFVGSEPVARYVYTTGTAHGKRVQALAGAKNHMVVMPDADLDLATDGLMGAAYGSAGERCMAVSVAVAVGSAGDALIDKLVPRIQGLKVGPGMDPASEMGPLVTREHRDKVAAYVDEGVREGAELVVDGRGLKLQGYENGNWLGGCLFDRVTPEMKIYREEIFGPVLSVVRVPDFETALSLTNAHKFGNGAAIFTRDGDAAREFSSRVAAGMVGVNVPIPVPMAFHSFGGWKASLYGDLHVHGPDGVRFFTKLKTVSSRWPTGIRAGAEFNMPVSR